MVFMFFEYGQSPIGEASSNSGGRLTGDDDDDCVVSNEVGTVILTVILYRSSLTVQTLLRQS